MAKEFEYVMTKEIGKVGNKAVELGHYIVDGKTQEDKVYVFDHYTKKDGTEQSKSVGKFTLEEFRALKEMEV